ncbi:ferredoxin [Treponema primitia ZAS-2]|uniref:Ion-translocating oxidoreductase complex subunit B n=1 Tax=Treponema primitia (strain ATCC BAA-887 / DSM 12427 / ZAS-2) TaxID=545694 RepID=F5YN71_TREPZ|nr:RnfABCDGE type electron transport complex subunit B [Treponema primitia]AEF85386.1 ferredoxin [Treponema primitia ZAS-2]
MSIVLITALFAAILAFVLGVALGFFKDFFAVEEDPLKGQVRECLPGANCGACGFPGCDGYATAVASGSAATNCCSVGGKDVAEKLSALMGVSAGSITPLVAIIACQGTPDKAPAKGNYTGLQTCRGAKLSTGGTKLCVWGCLGYGDCTVVCQFGALSLGENGLPKVDHTKCTGCKVCVAECPQGVIRAVAKDSQGAVVTCSNRNPLKATVLKTCKAGCIKCELCVKNCPENCITLQNGIPVVDYAKCTSCGTCGEKCPTKVFKILQKDVIAV